MSFTRIGALLIGGGYAMLPLLEDEIVKRRGWAKSEEMTDYFALAQVLPGVIAMNTAMLVGNRLRGFWGNLLAALGTVFVPFVLIVVYAIVYDRVRDFPVVVSVMAGVRPAVAGMIFGMGLAMLRREAKVRLGFYIAVFVCGLILVANPPVVALIAGAIFAGLAWNAIAVWKGKGAVK